MRDHYAVHEVTETKRIQHMDVLAGDDALRQAIETLPTGEAAHTEPRAVDGMDTPQLLRLASVAGNRAMTRLLARDTAVAATETVTVTLRWDQTQPPQEYLKDAFDENPVDWSADVYVDGKKAGNGAGSLDVSWSRARRTPSRWSRRAATTTARRRRSSRLKPARRTSSSATTARTASSRTRAGSTRA
jgi:hypothetical protein